MIEYTVIRSDRKTIALQLKTDGTLVVRCPRRMKPEAIRAFVQSKTGWIEKHLPRSAARENPFTEEELLGLSAQAKEELPRRAAVWAPKVGVSYGRITIRCQHSRWGSCSSKGNLNFNCLLMLAPPEVRDYVLIHELCHRKHMNHSAAFWAEVERVCPAYRVQKKWLKEQGTALIARLSDG